MVVKRWIAGVGILLIIMSHGLRAEPGLNGVAAYSELGNELFLAALYSGQTGTNAQELINGSYPKRIELKVLSTQGFTQRQFSRFWRESIAINNAQDLLIAQADNMIRFEGLIHDRLESNDHLVIGFIPAAGVSVSLNGVDLGHIKDDAFFGLLLRSWIGQVPSSTKFRDDLLAVTQADAALVNRFKSMYPRSARIEVVKSWREVPSPAAIDEPTEDVVLAPPAAVVIAAPIKPVALPVPVALAKSSAASSVAVAKAPEPEIMTIAADSPNEQDLQHAQELLAKQFYMADVFKKIYRHVNYPKRAQELQQAGTVRLSIVIDAVGNIKNVEPTDASQFLLLNKAALEAVKRAAPFAPLPNGFDLTELEMSVPITFSLDRG